MRAHVLFSIYICVTLFEKCWLFLTQPTFPDVKLFTVKSIVFVILRELFMLDIAWPWDGRVRGSWGRCWSWKWRSWKIGSMLFGFTGYLGLCCIWLWNQIWIWNIQTSCWQSWKSGLWNNFFPFVTPPLCGRVLQLYIYIYIYIYVGFFPLVSCLPLNIYYYESDE